MMSQSCLTKSTATYRHTISAKGKVQRISNSQINHTQKALILLLELLLIENLYGNDARFFHIPGNDELSELAI